MTKITVRDASNRLTLAFEKFSRELHEQIARTFGVPEEMIIGYTKADPAARARFTRAVDHLMKRGYGYELERGWFCLKHEMIVLTPQDADAMLCCLKIGKLKLPPSLTEEALTEYVRMMPPTREAARMAQAAADAAKAGEAESRYYRPKPPEAPDDFNKRPTDLTGVRLRHTGNGKIYKITGMVWLGETDKWGYLHKAEGEDGPDIARPLSHLDGKRKNGEPRYEFMGAEMVVDTAVAPREHFTAGELDTLTHALRLWATTGRNHGIEIRQDYVDEILNVALRNTPL